MVEERDPVAGVRHQTDMTLPPCVVRHRDILAHNQSRVSGFVAYFANNESWNVCTVQWLINSQMAQVEACHVEYRDIMSLSLNIFVLVSIYHDKSE